MKLRILFDMDKPNFDKARIEDENGNLLEGVTGVNIDIGIDGATATIKLNKFSCDVLTEDKSIETNKLNQKIFYANEPAKISQRCVCDMNVLMAKGCQCGSIKRE